MSDALSNTRTPFLAGIEDYDHKWGWFLTAGIILIILGALSDTFAVVATVASVVVFGSILLVAGIILIVLSAVTGRWSGFLLSLAAGLLSAITGLMLISAPVSGAVTLTLLIASFLAFTGIFRVLSAVVMRFPNWGWSVASGIVAIVLAGLLLSGQPSIGLWFIGFYIGVDLIVHGFAWIMFAWSVHRTSGRIEPEQRIRPAA